MQINPKRVYYFALYFNVLYFIFCVLLLEKNFVDKIETNKK